MHHVTPGTASAPVSPSPQPSPGARVAPAHSSATGRGASPDGKQGCECDNTGHMPDPAALATRQVLHKRPPWVSLNRA
jgi:hypothetical protein